MTLDEFMKDGIERLANEAAEKIAGFANNSDEAAGVPMAFMKIESKLLAAWNEALAELTGGNQRKKTIDNQPGSVIR